MPLQIRPLAPSDGRAAGQIFFDAVHRGAADVYTAEQRRAWAGDAPDLATWSNRLQDTFGFAAEHHGALAGFMTLDEAGHIDLAFVRPDLAGKGIGGALYVRIEAAARAQSLKQLTTEASLKARPFFERFDWQIVTEQSVVKRGVPLTNFRMVKALSEPPAL